MHSDMYKDNNITPEALKKQYMRNNGPPSEIRNMESNTKVFMPSTIKNAESSDVMWSGDGFTRAKELGFKKRKVKDELYERNPNLAHSIERKLIENPYDKDNEGS